MGVTNTRMSAAREKIGKQPDAFCLSDPAPTVIAPLDEESYETLASVAHEIGQELGGDGLLVTWHEHNRPARHLFADGACQAQSAIVLEIEQIGATALLQPGGTRSHWRTLASDPLSGVLTTTIPADRGLLVLAALFRRVGRSTRMTVGESAARLMPLLQPFFRTWVSRLRLAATVRALTAVVNDSDVGTLLIDQSGQIIFANSIAEGLIAKGNGLRRKGATIAGENSSDTLRLHAAIEGAVASRSTGRGRFSHRIVALRRTDGPPLIAAVVANRDAGSDEVDCAAVVYIVDPNQDLQMLVKPICDYFSLSPAETRLACTMVMGHSLSQAAEHLSLREQTARTYLKQIFLKTDTNRQAELVRLLLLSAVRAGHSNPN